MRFELTMNVGNAAFAESPVESQRLLLELADTLATTGNTFGRLYDINGNHVGAWKFIDEDGIP